MTRRNILFQLFDIRPRNQAGVLDWDRIKSVEPILDLRKIFLIPNQETILADLAAIEEIDQKLKFGLANFQEVAKSYYRLPVRLLETPRRQRVFINKFRLSLPSENFLKNWRDSAADFSSAARPTIHSAESSSVSFTLSPAQLFFKKFFFGSLWGRFILVAFLGAVVFFLAKDAAISLKFFKKTDLLADALELSREFLASDRAVLFKDLIKDYNVILNFLGFDRPKKYLLIFQNNSEMRPTGGFIGSYGILDLDRGKIKNLFIDDIYNIDGQLLEKIIPPRPLQRIATGWSTHDANWLADFPSSAQKITWFYEKTGGPTVDGVIAFTPKIIEDLLRVVGPVDLPAYGLTINAENFVEEIQYKVEKDFDVNLNQPKKILVDFTGLFKEKLTRSLGGGWADFLDVFQQALQQKHLLLYFRDEGLQSFVLKQRWAGQILEADGDYLSVINTNIGGGKTDRLIMEKIEHQAEIQADGSVIDTVKISRTHLGGQMKYQFWNQPNIDYLRVYVPRGVELISADLPIQSEINNLSTQLENFDYQKAGFKADPQIAAVENSLKIDTDSGTQIFEEAGKTVFANWFFLPPGQTREIAYRYRLPFLVSDQYALMIQKQAGSLGDRLAQTVKTPNKEWRDETVLEEDKTYNFPIQNY